MSKNDVAHYLLTLQSRADVQQVLSGLDKERVVQLQATPTLMIQGLGDGCGLVLKNSSDVHMGLYAGEDQILRAFIVLKYATGEFRVLGPLKGRSIHDGMQRVLECAADRKQLPDAICRIWMAGLIPDEEQP